MSLPLMLLLPVLACVVVAVLWLIKPVVDAFRAPPASSFAPTFVDPCVLQRVHHPFPSLLEPATLYMSVIVPAYNEENRLVDMLKETMSYLTQRQQTDPRFAPRATCRKCFSFEVIVVDDGSRDRTTHVALEFAKGFSTDVIRVMTLRVNQGKGGAVQQGMLHARGEYLLMADADGATRIRDLEDLETALSGVETNGYGIAVGSRAHLQSKAVAVRKWYRNVLMYGFHFLVALAGVRGIRDTQCGFKLFSRKSAQLLFSTQHLRRWCFDVELLYLAQLLKMPVVEVPVNWTEIPGSKVDIFSSSFSMARDLLAIRLAYLLDVWKVPHTL